ncbi:hypothetical protein M409DRAFT_59785 [Zasmidium cellare ATCC 36951]|uniref:non-specific serine/threonine protein kinase n=1 Tax=Zasmidium cellare ATCC 36951 TaxID=1080233 RepID=A0A6A6C1M0_ZASCE|nr:uncharacterized protein M409DRAFT_59785 [Zasmidium cellare ATCC 36951]KAF2160763.1 hypothetical protein M409DRAFT_59785 [Zasmidium cellare ATCC 36951]
MAPKSPWKNKTSVHANARQTVAASDAAAAVSPAINYAEVQAEEIDALKAIYMEDFDEEAVNTAAWGKSTDHTFKITIKPTSEDARPDDYVVLSVKLTATYPKSAPVLEVSGLEKFHERTQKRVRNVLVLKPKQMLGDVMIYVIAVEIQEALDDAVTARAQGTLPSLEEERASAEEVALTMAKEAEEAETRRQQEARAEEDRVLKQMVKEEVSRRDKRKSTKSAGDIPKLQSEKTMPQSIVFDQTAKVQVGNDIESFTEVTVNGLLFEGGKESVYLGKPKVSTAAEAPLVAIVRRKVEKQRGDIIELEAVLEAAHKLNHTSLVNLLAFRVDRINNFNSELILCRDYADRGSLYDLLSLCDLHVSKSRQFTIQLLEGLEHLHNNGMVHGGISARTIFLSANPSLAPKLANFGYASLLGLRDANLPCKWRSPDVDSKSQSSQRHVDLWDLGIVIIQMFLGLDATDTYTSPSVLLSKLELSEAFEDFLTKIFFSDAKKKPSCLDLLPAEFLRDDSPILQDTPTHAARRSRKSSSGVASPLHRRSRHNSSNLHEPFSRYANDFSDLGRLGKGGFGEVVKARNKLDGGVYAVKKIRQTQQLLEQVLKEVMLLNRLNHPYVVRYYSTWTESDMPGSQPQDAISTTEETLSDSPKVDYGYASTGGLDFVSSNALPGIQFEDDDDDDDDESNESDESDERDDGDKRDDGDSDDDPFERNGESNGLNGTSTVETDSELPESDLRLNKSRSDSRRTISTLYIQMELCDRRSLRDILRRPMDDDDSWRVMRQITEGLAHIHGHGIIHRDLKPDNVFIDANGNPKIGDFGLATTSNYSNQPGQIGSAGYGSVDMTRSIGTALYVAPELQSKSGSSYDEKVDMFSLGIMFFEMCQPFGTAMERINEIQRIRQKDHVLPPPFQSNGEKAAQGKLISCLISHKPSERPTSAKLLRSDMLPVKIEDETVRQALNGLSDPRSPYHQQLMSALFAHDAAGSQLVKARAWETKATISPDDIDRVRMRGIARFALQTVFRRHGAEESRRDTIFPRSGIYTNPNVFQLLDASGNLLQLPYDFTLPHAQQLARQVSKLRCSFTFGGAYRDAFTGGPPRVSEEADFDIVNFAQDDVALNDAEIIKVMDEVVSELPAFDNSANVCIQLNHGKLLDAVLDHCRVPIVLQHVVKETLSKLGVQQNTWKKIRPQLRNIGLSDTTLDDLQQYDWRDTANKAFNRLRALFDGTTPRNRSKVDEAIRHSEKILGFVNKLGLARKLFVAPLSCVNAKFYNDGMLFQCMLEGKKSSAVIAAGGRYDSLIRSHRMPEIDVPFQGAVGVTIGMDYLISHLLKNCAPGSKATFLKDPDHQHHLPRRCNVLVVASGTEALRNAGIGLVSKLWFHDISAELSQGSLPEQNYTFIVHMRHETSQTVRVTNTTTDGEDSDVALTSLIGHIQQELREQATSKFRRPLLRNHSSHQDGDRKSNNVQVLMASHRSKKPNKYGLVEAAQQHWSEKLEKMKDAPIVAIETRDEVLNLVQNTRLSDGESWKKAIQSVQLTERQYVQQIQELLDSWRKSWNTGDGAREVCVYNFRTSSCIYYDLGL